MIEHLTCPKCDYAGEPVVTYNPETNQRRAECFRCGAWIKWLKHERTFEWARAFEFPVGKHEGQTVETAYGADPEYVYWAAENLYYGNAQEACRVFLQGVTA